MLKIIKETEIGWRGVCSVKTPDGAYIFSAKEAREKGFLKQTRVYEIHRVDYGNEDNLSEAIKYMPDYQCWDSHRHVLCKAVEAP